MEPASLTTNGPAANSCNERPSGRLAAGVPHQRLRYQTGDLHSGGFLAHRNPNESENEPEILPPPARAPAEKLVRDIRRAMRKHHSV